MPKTDYFTGSGATGVPVQDAASLGARLELLSTIGVEHGWKAAKAFTGFGDMPKWCRDPQSPIRHYCNPGVHSTTKYQDYYLGLSQSTRDSQARTLLSTDIARTSLAQTSFEWRDASEYASASMKTEIVDAPDNTRAEYIKTVGNRYDLEPEVIAAIILTEQRDQSEAEDIMDYYLATVIRREATSVGLGQVTPLTAQIHDLFGDVFANYSYDNLVEVARLLADEAININATAKYLRMVADAGAQVENQNDNAVHKRDSRCAEPNDGTYENKGLRNLSVLSQPSTNWSGVEDPEIAGMQSPPSTIIENQSGSPMSLPAPELWDYARDHYYVGLLAEEYTTCPFEEIRKRTYDTAGTVTYPDETGPQTMSVSAGQTERLPGVLKFGVSLFEQQNNNWVFRTDIARALSGWRLWAAQAFADCRRTGLL